jgi:hypothetical protein
MSWPTIPGSGALTIDGSFTVSSAHNILLGERANIGSGANVLAIGNVQTNPASLGFEGGILYVESGHLMYIGQLGTVTNVASA